MTMPQERDHSIAENETYPTPTSAIHELKPSQQFSGGRIVVLNGFPGTGKFTILKRAKELLPADTTCLLDNHLLIDPAVAVIPGRNADHYELRRKIRAPVFESLRKRAQRGDVILMTACLAQNDTDAAFLEEHLDIVRGTDVPIFWINVYCDQSNLEQRVGSLERRQGGKTKLTDVGILRDLVQKHHLIEPHKSGDGSTRVVATTLDVSGEVDDSVTRLMDMVGLPRSIEAV